MVKVIWEAVPLYSGLWIHSQNLLSSQKHLSIREVAAVVMETSQLVLSQFKNF